jgi:N-terminal domain of (some) glycogen debranching enzymes
MGDELVKILDGNTFVVSDVRGDIEASPSDPMWPFSFDKRFLSRWVLSVNGRRLTSLSTDAGIRLRRQAPRCPARSPGLERSRIREPAREAGRRAEKAVQPRLLGGGRSVLRARSRY